MRVEPETNSKSAPRSSSDTQSGYSRSFVKLAIRNSQFEISSPSFVKFAIRNSQFEISSPSFVKFAIRNSQFAILFALLLFATGSVSSNNQQDQPPARESGRKEPATRMGERNSQSILVEPSEDYRIGPRDVLEIEVEDAPELSGVFEVNSKGTIPMRYLRVISVQGKTSEEVAKFIADGLRVKYLKDPRVSITIKQYNSRTFFIQGSVRTPGVYQIESRASLFKLINLAGGLQDDHGSTAFIVREVKKDAATQPATDPPPQSSQLTDSAAQQPADQATEQYEMTPANIAGLQNGHFEQNVMLRPGDLVIIPKTDLFFVSGEVVQPGEYPLKPNTTVGQAITLARGVTFNAAKGKTIIFREDEKSGERVKIDVDLGAIMSGKKPDVPLRKNDVIQVPNSSFRSIGGRLLNAFGMNSVMRGVPVR
jgi:polysaccharide export outer membrane protein